MDLYADAYGLLMLTYAEQALVWSLGGCSGRVCIYSADRMLRSRSSSLVDQQLLTWTSGRRAYAHIISISNDTIRGGRPASMTAWDHTHHNQTTILVATFHWKKTIRYKMAS